MSMYRDSHKRGRKPYQHSLGDYSKDIEVSSRNDMDPFAPWVDPDFIIQNGECQRRTFTKPDEIHEYYFSYMGYHNHRWGPIPISCDGRSVDEARSLLTAAMSERGKPPIKLMDITRDAYNQLMEIIDIKDE